MSSWWAARLSTKPSRTRSAPTPIAAMRPWPWRPQRPSWRSARARLSPKPDRAHLERDEQDPADSRGGVFPCLWKELLEKHQRPDLNAFAQDFGIREVGVGEGAVGTEPCPRGVGIVGLD